jgi:glyoxylase-like metal-dependent hydrolase (beta-lactamase superfamily II)
MTDVQVDEVASGVWHARAKHVGWVLLTEGDRVTLVDTGYPGDRDRVLASLERIGRSPADVEAVVLTHAHPDHLGSAEHFRTERSTPVWTHEAEAAHARGERIEQVSTSAVLRLAWRRDVRRWMRDAARLKVTRAERLGEVTTFAEHVLDVPGHPVAVHTPGHTSGHCVLHLPGRGVLLAGDALMTEHALVSAPGPQLLPDFFHHEPEEARASLRRLVTLEAEAVVPGHGPVFRGSPAEAVEAALAVAALGAGSHTEHLDYGAVLPLSEKEAFAFITDPDTWPSFFDHLRLTERDPDWGRTGGHARMTNRILGRTLRSELELTEWDPPRAFRYVAHQAGEPDLDNRRVFEAVPGGTRLHGTTTMVVRAGTAGVTDRARLRVMDRMYRKAMAKVPEVAARHHADAEGGGAVPPRGPDDAGAPPTAGGP